MVYVLSKGEIIEEGSFDFLSNKQGGKLKEMIMSQTNP